VRPRDRPPSPVAASGARARIDVERQPVRPGKALDRVVRNRRHRGEDRDPMTRAAPSLRSRTPLWPVNRWRSGPPRRWPRRARGVRRANPRASGAWRRRRTRTTPGVDRATSAHDDPRDRQGSSIAIAAPRLLGPSRPAMSPEDSRSSRSAGWTVLAHEPPPHQRAATGTAAVNTFRARKARVTPGAREQDREGHPVRCGIAELLQDRREVPGFPVAHGRSGQRARRLRE
jgi:hypothetical protein